MASAAEAWRALSNAAKARLLDECALCLEEGLEEMAVDSVARKGSAGSGLGDEMCVCLSPIRLQSPVLCSALNRRGTSRSRDERRR